MNVKTKQERDLKCAWPECGGRIEQFFIGAENAKEFRHSNPILDAQHPACESLERVEAYEFAADELKALIMDLPLVFSQHQWYEALQLALKP